MRTLVDIPDKELKALNLLSKQRKVSRASLVREAVSTYLATKSKAARDARIDASAGLWKNRNDIGDSVEYQRKLRAEWDREWDR